MRTRHLTISTLGGAFLLAATAVGAATDPLTASPFVGAQQQSGISFVSGGIGVCERKALDQVASDFNLKLVFATADGHYLNRRRRGAD